MNIAHVVATFPPDIGGMGRVAYDEGIALTKNGHEVAFFCLRYFGGNYQDDGPLKVQRLMPIIKSGDAGMVPQLLPKLKSFDLIHLHYPWYGGAEWVLFASYFYKKKYLLTYHMDAAPTTGFRKAVRWFYDSFLAGLIFKKAEKIFVPDKEHFEKSRFGKKIAEDKIVELSNPVDTNTFKPSSVDNKSLALFSGWENKKIILFVGNLMPVKRFDLLLTALKNVPEAVLLAVGGGYEEEMCKQLARDLGVIDRVRFAGRVNDPSELAKYYSAATVTVIPSDAESFSLVTIESMACKTPVVGSDALGLKGRVTSGFDGFLFDKGLADSLAEAINKMLNLTDDEIKLMGENGRKKVEEMYSLEDHVKKLEEIYRLVC